MCSSMGLLKVGGSCVEEGAMVGECAREIGIWSGRGGVGDGESDWGKREVTEKEGAVEAEEVRKEE